VLAPPACGQGADEFAVHLQTALGVKHPYLLDGDFTRDREAIQAAYARHDGALWVRNGELTRQGATLIQVLRSVGEHGLREDDYEGTQLFYRAVEVITDRDALTTRWVDLDLGITIAAVRMIRHLHFGRIDPRAAGFKLATPRAPLDVSAVIAQLATSNDIEAVLVTIEPQFLHYRLLKSALQRYRLLAIDRELVELPQLAARSVKPGEIYTGSSKLRKLLIAFGDLPAAATGSDELFDATLSDGLKRFQQRHGLTADGALGRKTLLELRTPLAARVRQLELALERWRWLPELTEPPIIVNIPQFRLFAFRGPADHAADMREMDVIVGKTYPTTQTPAFTAELKYVVFRPYWDIPSSILVDEMLPAIRADADYLAKNNLEIVSSSDSNAVPVTPSPEAIEQLVGGALRLRQRPGDDNSLGLVKLMLPNPYNVYLHSTPARRLFQESRRAFSHGCIRVSDPAGLVEHVLRNEPGPDNGQWTREKIEAALHDDSPTGNNRHVFLSKPIPVLIVYGTAMAGENGEVLFFEDLYGHDETLEKLLY